MLTTRCPACGTIFRIRPEQLNQRGGRVRCGHCHNAFLALSTLEELPDDTDLVAASRKPANPPAAALAAAPTTPATTLPPANVQHPVTATPAPATAPVATPPAAFSAPEPVVPRPATSAPPVVAAPAAETPAAKPAVDVDAESMAFAARTLIAEPLDEMADGRIEPSLRAAIPAPDFEIPLDEDADFKEPSTHTWASRTGGLEFPPLNAEETPSSSAAKHDDGVIEISGLEDFDDTLTPEADARRKARQENVLLVEEGDEALVDALQQMDEEDAALKQDESEPRTLFLDDEVIPRRKPRTRPLFWWLGTALLALLALGQAAFLWRTQLVSAVPGLRQPFTQVCEVFGCNVPYPTQADQISVEATDLNPDPIQAGRFRLTVTLRNRARFAQSWPHLELTLTDRFDRAISRRVLTPAEWLPASAAQNPAFGPLGEVTAQVVFTTELPAAGYRLYAFYP